MENDKFTPPTSQDIPDPPYSWKKDPFAEPPIKDLSHLLQEQTAQKSSKAVAPSRHRGALIISSVIMLIAIAGAVFIYTQHSSHHAAVVHQPIGKAAVAKITMKQYSSAGFGVSFTYPSNWTVADGDTTSLSIISPVMKLLSASGGTVNGKILVMMVPQGQLPAAFGSSNAVSVLPSQLIAYSNPTSSQRAQTYVSFVQYSSATLSGTLNGIYVTGNSGYQQDQAIPATDITTLNPLITVTFGQCVTKSCTNITALALSATSWNKAAFSGPILSILKSLSFN